MEYNVEDIVMVHTEIVGEKKERKLTTKTFFLK